MHNQPRGTDPIRKVVTVPAPVGPPAGGMRMRGRLVVLHNDLLASPGKAVP